MGHSALETLAKDWSVPILRELAVSPSRPSELERLMPRLPHSALMRRLAEMCSKGIVTREHHTGLQPQTVYGLTPAGRCLLLVQDSAEAWETHWSKDALRRDGTPISALRLIGDERTRELLLAIAEGPTSFVELQRRFPEVGRSTLRQRLADLMRRRLLVRCQPPRPVSYALTQAARQLALVEIAAARWEWQWARPTQPVASADLAGVFYLFAPIARFPLERAGTCRLHVQGPDERDIYLIAKDGSISAPSSRPQQPVDAHSRAPADGWCDALLLAHLHRLTTSGDRPLFAAMLRSVAAALRA